MTVSMPSAATASSWRSCRRRRRWPEETLRIAQNRYRNGYSSYLDVLDAQRTLFSTQLSVVQVKNNLLLAQVDLYRSLGGGWSDSSGM